MNKTKPSIWVETDLEPDDVLALKVLQRKTHISNIVVGEGNSKIKVNRIKNYVKLLGLASCTRIIKGIGSKKPFPMDGREFDLLDQHDKHTNSNIKVFHHEQQYVKDIVEYINSNQTPTLIILKPFRELMKYWKQIPTELIEKTTIWIYGSFNFRTLMNDKTNSTNTEQILNILHSFHRVYLYESFFATGENNDINKLNMPKVYETFSSLKHIDPFFNVFEQLMFNWNTHMLQSSWKTVKKCKENQEYQDVSGKCDRALKIVNNIGIHFNFQIVCADLALVVCFNEKHIMEQYFHKIELQFDPVTKYSTFNKVNDSSSRIFAAQNIPWDLLEKEIVQQLF